MTTKVIVAVIRTNGYEVGANVGCVETPGVKDPEIMKPPGVVMQMA